MNLQKNQCIQEKTKAGTITRYDSDCVEKARAWLASDEGAVLFGLRKTVIEGLFGQAKSFHGLARAKLRGIEKMEIQVLLTATTLNLKKLVRNGL
ncbi:MAG: transposase [Actinomycetota bacterium]|nr:transposase [Actinomycetota bacterium]